MKQIDLLAALVADCERGSDTVVLKSLAYEVDGLIAETYLKLIDLGNECPSLLEAAKR